MTEEKTIPIQKEPQKEILHINHRPITFLPTMLKILTAQIKEDLYYSFEFRGLFLAKQNGRLKGTRETHDLLYIDQHILKASKSKRENGID